jgi:hypothetical protein
MAPALPFGAKPAASTACTYSPSQSVSALMCTAKSRPSVGPPLWMIPATLLFAVASVTRAPACKARSAFSTSLREAGLLNGRRSRLGVNLLAFLQQFGNPGLNGLLLG